MKTGKDRTDVATRMPTATRSARGETQIVSQHLRRGTALRPWDLRLLASRTANESISLVPNPQVCADLLGQPEELIYNFHWLFYSTEPRVREVGGGRQLGFLSCPQPLLRLGLRKKGGVLGLPGGLFASLLPRPSPFFHLL